MNGQAEEIKRNDTFNPRSVLVKIIEDNGHQVIRVDNSFEGCTLNNGIVGE